MVYDTLHKHITSLAWGDAEGTLKTDKGKLMATEKYKSDLPLHMAIERRAPDSLILSILRAHPNATSIKGKCGSLPLHIASEHNLSADVIVELIKSYPEALDVADDNQVTPRDYPHRGGLSREALMRPTACWIEDLEKQAYHLRVATRRKELREKIKQLKAATLRSVESRKEVSDIITRIEPRIAKHDENSVQGELLSSQLEKTTELMYEHLKKIKDRVSAIEQKVDGGNQTEINMMNSILKREYVETVKCSYEKLLSYQDQIKKDINEMKGVLSDQTLDETESCASSMISYRTISKNLIES